MKSIAIFSILIALALILTSCVNIQPPQIRVELPAQLYAGKPFEVKITVVGSLGFPLRNVEIRVDGETYTTDNSGSVRLPFFFSASGSYALKVSYETVSKDIDLNVEPASWLVLCWFGADNDITEYVEFDLEEMKLAAKDVAVIAMVDKVGIVDDGVYALSLEGTFVKLELFNEVDSGSGSNLSWFVEKYQSCDANHRALILWNHGNAWNDTNPYEPKGISYDYQSKSFLTTLELKEALEGFHFDVIGFDACLMGSVEVLYELKDLADYFIAAADEIPATGWDYVFLKDVSGSNAVDFCEKAVEQWRHYYRDDSSEALLNAWNSEELSNAVGSLADKLRSTQPSSIPAASVYLNEPNEPRLCDLGEVLENLNWENVLSQFQSARVPTASDSQIYLSVFLPRTRDQLDPYRDMYSQLAFAQIGWLEWLDSVLNGSP